MSKKKASLDAFFMCAALVSGAGLAQVIVLRSGDQVQRNMRLRIDTGHLETADDLQMSFTQPGRLFFLCLKHSRVIHGDFIES